jgi:hypothetical protein
LQQIASEPYWRRNEPDLVAAAFVGLVALGDDESKVVLEKLAHHPWKASEKWVGEAAQMCLKDWETRAENALRLTTRFHS